jgi:SAM-dependent methyltransferase
MTFCESAAPVVFLFGAREKSALLSEDFATQKAGFMSSREEIESDNRMDTLKNAEDSTYFMPSELAEIARLLNQDRLVTSAVSLLPASIDAASLERVLDIGCGPGGWLLDLTSQYPSIAGVGIDLSQEMIRYANHLKLAEGKTQNALTFMLMDARQQLDFPDESFDFVQMRLCHSFLRPHMWSLILQECHRVLRSGGSLCLTDLEITFSNKAAMEEACVLLPLVWKKGGLSFSPAGRSMGILAALPSLLCRAGFGERSVTFHAIDASKDSPNHAIGMENIVAIFTGIRETYEKIGGFSPDYLSDLMQRFTNEMQEEDFTCFALLFSIYSKRL